MFLAKESILKDGSFLPILLQPETMLLFAGHFLGTRRTLENLFVRLKRTLNGVSALKVKHSALFIFV